jgi:SAM-dependent methyltransferase
MSEKKSSTASKEKPREQTSSGFRGPHEETRFLRGAQWWEPFFDLTYARLDLDSIGIEQTRKEVDFLIIALEASKNSRILDIGSGLGRHALEFARRGFVHITGLDQSSIFIEESRARARFENLSVRFLNADARSIPFHGGFDAAYIWMNLLGYFDDSSDDARTLVSAAHALKSGGRLLLNLMNRDWVIRNFSPKGWKEMHREYVLEGRSLDLTTSTVHSTWTMFTRTGTYKREMRLRLYSLHELIEMLKSNGLRFETAWGSLDAEPATFDSNHFKILARKEA